MLVGPSNVVLPPKVALRLNDGLVGKSKPAFSRVGVFCADACADTTRERMGITGVGPSSSSIFRKELTVLVRDLGPRRGGIAVVALSPDVLS